MGKISSKDSVKESDKVCFYFDSIFIKNKKKYSFYQKDFLPSNSINCVDLFIKEFLESGRDEFSFDGEKFNLYDFLSEEKIKEFVRDNLIKFFTSKKLVENIISSERYHFKIAIIRREELFFLARKNKKYLEMKYIFLDE